MQAEHLATLAALADTGTFDATATRLHITPSAVSQRVKSMEQATGTVLVLRTTPVTLTDAGMVVLRHARQVELLEVDTARSLRSLVSEGARFRLPIAVNADSLATWFLPAIAGLGDDLDLAFDLRREDQQHTTSLLRSGTVMAAVTSTREPVQGCSTSGLGVMRYLAVCSPAFRTRWFPDVSTETLGEAPVVHFDPSDDLQDSFLARWPGAGLGAPRHYIPTSDDFARAVVMGFGWGMLPEQQCLDGLASGSLVELVPSTWIDVPLYWQRWNLESPLLDGVSAAVGAAAAGALRPL